MRSVRCTRELNPNSSRRSCVWRSLVSPLCTTEPVRRTRTNPPVGEAPLLPEGGRVDTSRAQSGMSGPGLTVIRSSAGDLLHGLHPRRYVQLFIDMFEMPLHGLGCDAQRFGNFLVGQPARH